METSAAPFQPADDRPWWSALDPRQSLTARAVLIAGGGTLVFAMVLSWVASTSLRRQLERPLGASLETMAVQIADTLDRSAYERTHALQFTASLAALRNAATPPLERRRVLEAALVASPDLAWVGFANADGKIVSGTQGFLENSDATAAPWFRGAREQPFTGEVREVPELAREIPGANNEPPRFLALAAPVVNIDNQFVGVLVAQLNWSRARDLQAAVLTDAARRARTNLTIYNARGDALLDSGALGWTEPPPSPNLADRQLTRGFFRETVSGDADYLTGFARSRGFRDFRGLGFLVAVRQPVAEVDAPVAALRRVVVTWGISLSAVFAVVSGIFAARVARRLRAVGAAAERIRTGDVLTLMPRARGAQELDEMCGALDAMVTDFRAKQEKLAPEKSRPEILPASRVKDRDVSKFV